ncbi:MAG: carboxypeptidase-like regulatory domain-containing protein [Mediterranea sp.]|jgi:hypothetical protein|nr:carboxypeptidase-like regulatory domain-containing protein [Mediterranea sp.]
MKKPIRLNIEALRDEMPVLRKKAKCRIMRRLTLFCLLLLCYIIVNAGEGKGCAVMTIRFENQLLGSALSTLEEKSGYSFIYQDKIEDNLTEVSPIPTQKECTALWMNGKVIDADGNDAIGATIYIKKNGENIYPFTFTDEDGRFNLPANANDNTQIVVEYLGFLPRIVSISDISLIKLELDSTRLSEIIHTGPPPRRITVGDSFKQRGITFTPNRQYAVVTEKPDCACENESCPLRNIGEGYRLIHIDGECEIMICSSEENNSLPQKQPSISSYSKIKKDLGSGKIGLTSKRDIKDLDMMLNYYPQDRAKAIFNADYLLCYPYNMHGMTHKNHFICARAIVTGKNGLDVFIYFVLTDKAAENFDTYLAGFRKTLWFED